MSIVVPAVLPKSREDLDEKLALLANIPVVTRIQIDVVDGVFASPASWPYNVRGGLTSAGRSDLREFAFPHLGHIEYEVDLMCLDALEAAGAWLAQGASRLTLHAEATTDLSRLLDSVRERYGEHAFALGIALNIESDALLIERCFGRIDYVQFMGINTIGRQGQLFNPRVLKKIGVFHAAHPGIPLQVDGGVSLETAPALLAVGVSSLVVGSALLNAPDPTAAFAAFNAL